MAAFRFAQISDLHLGHSGQPTWHNHELLDHATTLTGAAVTAINAAAPDFVVVTGDLTHVGSPESFAVARSALDGLQMPYYVLPGNHDVLLPEARRHFCTAFAGHVPPDRAHQTWEYGGARFLMLDAWWQDDSGGLHEAQIKGSTRGMALPPEQVKWLEQELQAHRSQPVFVFMHFPLLPIADRYLRLQPKDAGHLRNGAEVLNVLKRNPNAAAFFCGHQHYNEIERIQRGDDSGEGSAPLLHCVLGATVEYPMMWREVRYDGGVLRIETHLSPAGELRDLSLTGNDWVTGNESDRSAYLALQAAQ